MVNLVYNGVFFVAQVVQDVIDEICAKIGVVSQMEQDEYTVFAMVEAGTHTKHLCVLCTCQEFMLHHHRSSNVCLHDSLSNTTKLGVLILRKRGLITSSNSNGLFIVTDNEYARLKREEYVMDVVTEMRLQKKDCVLMFERTSWYFPLRLETVSHDYLDMVFNQCIPDYIDGYLLALDHRNQIPARQLVSKLTRSVKLKETPDFSKHTFRYNIDKYWNFFFFTNKFKRIY